MVENVNTEKLLSNIQMYVINLLVPVGNTSVVSAYFVSTVKTF